MAGFENIQALSAFPRRHGFVGGRRARGLVLLAAAASLSVMSALGLAMIGTPGTQLGQISQLVVADQARQNAESGYFFGLSAVREHGLAAARAAWEGNTIEIPGGTGSFRLEFVDLDSAPIHLAQPQTIVPGDNLEGISLPAGSSLPRREGSFVFDGVEYRYDSFESDVGTLTNVRPVDPLLTGPFTFDASIGPMMTTARTDIRSLGAAGEVEFVFRRQVEERPPPPCDLPWGGQIQVGQSVTAFETNEMACGSVCQSEIRVCSAVRLPARNPFVIEYDSQLSGSFTNSSCSVLACGCTLPPPHFGLIVPDFPTHVSNGQTVRFWRENSVPAGQSCTSEQRLCSDGVLSGSFTFQTCLVQGSYSHEIASPPRGERSVRDILTDLYGSSMGIVRQFDYGGHNDQVWRNPGAIEVVFLARYAGHRHEFGFLRGLDGSEFISAFPAPTHSNATQLDFRPEPGTGRVLTQAETGEYFRFAMRDLNTGNVWSSRVRDNWDSFDHMITFTLGDNANNVPIRVLSWEDLAHGGDQDHNDLLVEVRGAWLAGPGFCEGCQ